MYVYIYRLTYVYIYVYIYIYAYYVYIYVYVYVSLSLSLGFSPPDLLDHSVLLVLVTLCFVELARPFRQSKVATQPLDPSGLSVCRGILLSPKQKDEKTLERV